MSLRNQSPYNGAAMLGACCAIIASLPLAAFLGALCGDTYDTRVTVYGCILLWVVIGAATIFAVTKDAPVKPVTFRMIVLWFVSTWVWPIPILVWYRNKKQ